MTTTADRNQTARLSALEEGYKNLGREIGGIRSDVQSLAVEIRAELNRRARVQWSPMIAAVAVVITVIGAFAQGPLRDIQRNDEQIRHMTGNRFTDRDGQLVQAQLDKIWSRIEKIEDEDFDRPEAEQMFDRFTQQVDRLHDSMTDLSKEVYRGTSPDVR